MKIDEIYFVSLLSSPLLSSVQSIKFIDYVFMQNNDLKDNLRLDKDFFREKNIELLYWSAYSSDCNLIENLWGII